MRHMAEQLRFSCRSLARSPWFTVVTVLTLALGIGAVISIHAVLERVVLRPLPYPESDRLVTIRSVVPGLSPGDVWGISEAGYFFFADQSRTIETIGAADDVWVDVRLTLTGTDGAVRVAGDSITASMLALLGARPLHGRLFDESDDRPGAPLVVILSHGVWAAHYGADPTVVGRTIRVDGSPREVIGVMEPGFRIPGREAGAWVPLRLDPTRPAVNEHSWGGIARLHPGVALAQAQEELDRLTARLPDVHPGAYPTEWMEQTGFATRIEPLRDHVIGNAAHALWTLFGGVGLVLLIALANVANLFMLRVEERRYELAIRTAHGASRWHLAAEGFAEGLIIAALAATIGTFLASYALDVLILVSPPAIPRVSELGIGWASIGLTLVFAVVAATLIGPLPRVLAQAGGSSLSEGGRAHTASRSRQAIRRTLVTTQVAVALLLLTAAGLMVRSFDRLHNQDKGFDDRDVLAFQVAVPVVRYGDPVASARFYRELTERLQAIPAVQSVGAASHLPLGSTSDGCFTTFSDDRPQMPGEAPPCVDVWAITPGYLETLGITVDGRIAGWDEVDGGTPAIVVTKAAADRFWPAQNPIGKRIRGFSWGQAPHYVVTGVSGDIRAEGVDREPLEAIFLPIRPLPGTPLNQWGPFWGAERELHIVVKSASGATETLVTAVRSILEDMDPDVAAGAFTTMSGLVARSESVARTSLLLFLLGAAAVIALFLSVVGLYGVVSFFVRQRTREIGVRIALGANAGIVTRDVMRQALTVAVSGVAAGVISAAALTRLLRSLLFEIHPNDPVALGAAVVVLVTATALAAWLPARRATRIDPMIALQQE